MLNRPAAVCPVTGLVEVCSEALPPEAYDKLSYYEKWISSLTQTLLQRGVISTEELGRKMEEVAGRKK